ncbi:hypothetical protein SESBI_07999 [Sesbania bispinosa]|nr:hypothetical protein SESBI_07999 [Sesbania bispinosa]
MVCQLECTSSDSSECNFSEGEDDDIGAHLFKDMMQNYVEGNSNANLKCQLLENSVSSPINCDINVPDCDINSELMPENAGVNLLDSNLQPFDKGICGTVGKLVGESLVEVAEPPANVCVVKPSVSKHCPFICASAVPRSDGASGPITIAYVSDPIPKSCATKNQSSEAGLLTCTIGSNVGELPRSVADADPIVCTAGPNAKPSSEVANAARLLLCEETSSPSPIVVAVRPFEDAASPGPIEGPVNPSISSPLDAMLQVGNKQMQGTNSSPLQGRDHSLTPPHYSEELVEVSKQLKMVGVGDAILGTNAENLTVQIEDPQLCEVPIVLEGEIECSGKPTQLEVVGGQKRGRGRPRKRAHVKAKVSNLPLNALLDVVVLEENPQLVANKVWHIGEKLGVTLEGETMKMVQKLTEMEERDRKVVGRIRSVGGT